MPVPTEDAGPGQSPRPTQPIPFTASGKPMEPVSPIVPLEIPPDSPLSYSSQTGLLYVAAIDQPLNSGRGPKGYFSAYDPTKGELKWRQIFEGFGQAGSVVTAGGLVFVGTGNGARRGGSKDRASARTLVEKDFPRLHPARMLAYSRFTPVPRFIAVGSRPFQQARRRLHHYTLPWWAIQVNAAFQSYAGRQLDTRWSISRTTRYAANCIAPCRPGELVIPNQTLATYVLDLVAPGQGYYERQNQLDLGFRRVFRIGKIQYSGQADIFNATNSSYVKNQNITLGPSLGQPLDILNPRVLRLAMQMRF